MPATQLLGICGQGRLLDGSECSAELREYLRQADSSRLIRFFDECLSGFDQSGSVLQDVVNELGRRLEFQVENGLYQGRRDEVGFDGIWRLPSGFALVVEVKTTDVYNINLERIATYRERLMESHDIGRDSSILIVVGRQETDSLEGQIRGSRHAWDVRMVSLDALKKLLLVKEQSEDATAERISQLLRPFEYTRVDRIIDIVFETSQDVEEAVEPVITVVAEQATRTAGNYVFTPHVEIEAQKQLVLRAFTARLASPVVKKTRSQYWSPDDGHSIRLVCTISKLHSEAGYYWYSYGPRWDAFLEPAETAVYALGMMGRQEAIFIPRSWLVDHLDELGTTTSGDMFWHVVVKPIDGELCLIRKAGYPPLSLQEFVVPLE